MKSKSEAPSEKISPGETPDWAYHEHPVTRAFTQRVAEMVDDLERRGRGQDLDKIARYTQKSRGAVSRLTAVFWTIDEDYQSPVREMVEEFRRSAAAQFGQAPEDEVVYGLMYAVYLQKRGASAP